MKKIVLVIGLAVGFVLGSRMGREPYEKLEEKARSFAGDPRVQEKVTQAKDVATKTAQDAADTAKTKGPEVAGQLKDRVSGNSSAKDSGDTAPNADTDGRRAASTGGDAQVGDKPLNS